MTTPSFEHKGFIKEYYINNVFIGYIRINDSEGRKIGYVGKQNETVDSLILLFNGKKIKPNTLVSTIIYPVNGAFLK